MSGFKRAITADQKTQRRQTILDVAKELFVHSDFQAIKIAEIAANAGLGKGSVFLYFKSKEELFICLTIQEFEKWNDKFKSFLCNDHNEGKMDSKKLLEILDKTFLDNSILIRLLAMSNTILEQNISYEQASQYKEIFNKHIKHIGEMLEKNIAYFQNGDGTKFIMYCFALTTGLYQMSNPPAVIQQVLQKFEYPIFNIDFKAYFLEMLKLIMDGMESHFNN